MGLILGGGTTKPQYPYDMWYGVQGDFTSKDYKLIRVGNMDLHRTLPIQNKLRRFVENQDGSVKYYLHQNDSRKKETGANAIIDSTDGNVMLEKPEYYCRFEVNGTKWVFAISEYPLPGFVKMSRKTISPWYATVDSTKSLAVSGSWLQWNENNELVRDTNGYISLLANAVDFRGGSGVNATSWDGTHKSMLGMPRTNLSKDIMRSYCTNGLHIGAARAYMEIGWLFRVEYATMHTQDVYNETLTSDGFRQGGLGNGTSVDNAEWNNGNGCMPFIPCGVTAILGNNTGRVPYTIKGWQGGDKIIYVDSYRGLETPKEYLSLICDDLLIHIASASEASLGHLTPYGCNDPTKFCSPNDNASIIPDGYYSLCELPIGIGTVWNFGFSYDGFTLPASVGVTSNQGMCDAYFYLANYLGWCSVTLAGDANTGSGCGFSLFFCNTRNSWVNPKGGFRICRY